MEIISKFILIKHKAVRAGLHIDLRFRIPDSKDWASFATKKEIPLNSGKKILLIQTTLHSEKEALLTGTIKSGYGAGTLSKIDGGSCIILKYSKHHIAIDFRGKVLTGVYHFINMTKLGENQESYLFFKSKGSEKMSEKVVLSENAQKVVESRYFMEDENWENFPERIAEKISELEGDQKDHFRTKFKNMIYNMEFLPGGRILRNAGREKGTLLNCYHLPCGDSIEEIGDFIKESLILWSDGGGVGCNFSSLRPKGDKIKGKGGVSSGLVSFIEAADYVSKTVESGGARRAAALASVDVSHPEVIDFINAKLVDGKLSHFNISVGITNEFVSAVEHDADWDLTFKDKIYKTIPAREIWNLIIENLVKTAEPGLLNMSNVTENNSQYFYPVTGVNPCGEATLSHHESCDLGSLVLPKFINENGVTDWGKLREDIFNGVRFLDNVLDLNKFTINKIQEKAYNARRIGLGVMGLAEYLFAKKVRYGSDESIKVIQELFEFIRDNGYRASIALAIEKGPFPKFVAEKYIQSKFIRNLPVDIRKDIITHGIRNVTILSIAPTGTISLIPEVSNGIEPLFAKSYIRKDRVGNRIYLHPKYEELLISEVKVPDWFVDSYDLLPEAHVKVQAAIQHYVDGAVSKTINMPKGTTPEQLSELLLKYIRELKGTTVYIDGSRGSQPLNRMSDQESIRYLKRKGVLKSSSLTEEDVECYVCNSQKSK
jgi:ribonucleoside-diphosphate reductase alpha chain